jgi:hypothetical protein
MAFPFDLGPTLTIGPRVFRFPFPCKITNAVLTVNVGGTLGQGASGVSDISILAVGLPPALLFSQVGYNSQVINMTAAGLAIEITDSSLDYSIQIVTPVFSTAPTAVRRHMALFFNKL